MPATEMDRPSHEEIMSKNTKLKGNSSKSDLELFDDVFPTLVDVLTKQGRKDEEIGAAIEYFKKVLEYNVPHGKKNRGLTVVHSYQFLVSDPKEDDLLIARVLGWCIELLQAYFLVADDVMDASVTRRGQPCWYKCQGVGMEAINDSFYLGSSLYVLLKQYCRHKPYYTALLELFNETTLQTVTGQCLDMMSSTSGKVDFSQFTLDRYRAIVKWKTAFYSFYLPVACALYMAGIEDEKSHTKAKEILLKMGEYFQIQDDYLDCYGDPAVTGKVGTDIEDNKCSWLVVQALQGISSEQRLLLEENYAKHDAEKVAVVKGIFKNLDIQNLYREYEESSYKEIEKLIEKLGDELPQSMFTAFAKKIYKRQK